jgi:hypothetical protein
LKKNQQPVFAVSFANHKSALWIFHTYKPQANPPEKLRDKYLPLVCPKCRCYDPLEAAKLGISREVVLQKAIRDRDIVHSEDGRAIVSSRTRKVLSGIPGFQAHFFPLPGDRDFSVMLPIEKHMIAKKVVVNGDIFKYALRSEDPKCRECKRYPCMLITMHLAEFKSPVVMGAQILEGGPISGCRETWFCSDEVRQAVKKAKLKGWLFKSLPDLKKA